MLNSWILFQGFIDISAAAADRRFDVIFGGRKNKSQRNKTKGTLEFEGVKSNC